MKMHVSIKRDRTPAQAKLILMDARKTKEDRVERGLLAIGNFLLLASRASCPKDTRLLVDSSSVRQFNKGIETIVTVGYGPLDHGMKTRWSYKLGKEVSRDPSEYAVVVHFDASMKHSEGEYAYFLQGPRDGEQDEMRRIFWSEMSK
jgi:hypothetical protein